MTTTAPCSRLLTTADAANILCVSKRSVFDLTKSGKLRCVRPTPFSVRYTDADLAEFMEGLRNQAKPATVA